MLPDVTMGMAWRLWVVLVLSACSSSIYHLGRETDDGGAEAAADVLLSLDGSGGTADAAREPVGVFWSTCDLQTWYDYDANDNRNPCSPLIAELVELNVSSSAPAFVICEFTSPEARETRCSIECRDGAREAETMCVAVGGSCQPAPYYNPGAPNRKVCLPDVDAG